MRAHITLAFVSLLAGLACNGPISDWPPAAEKPDDGPSATPGGRQDASVGAADKDAGLPSASLDAGAGGGADDAASTDAGQSAPACGDAALDANEARADDAGDADPTGATLPDADLNGSARPAPPVSDAGPPDAMVAADPDASPDATAADATPLTAPCL